MSPCCCSHSHNDVPQLAQQNIHSCTHEVRSLYLWQFRAKYLYSGVGRGSHVISMIMFDTLRGNLEVLPLRYSILSHLLTRSGNILSFLLPLFQEGQRSITGESMCTKYCQTVRRSKPAQEKCG